VALAVLTVVAVVVVAVAAEDMVIVGHIRDEAAAYLL
jgi:hypothetical protein